MTTQMTTDAIETPPLITARVQLLKAELYGLPSFDTPEQRARMLASRFGTKAMECRAMGDLDMAAWLHEQQLNITEVFQ